MADSNSKHPAGLTTPARRAVAVTPNDSTDLADVPRALWVGGTGNISLIMQDDSSAVLFTAVTVGYHPLRAKRIRATDTTATNIVALY